MKPEAVPHSEQDEKHEDHDEHDPNLKEFSNVQMKSIVIRGWICLFGGVCMHLVLGTFYLWGGISPYVAAYLKSKDSSVSLQTMAVIFPILGLVTNAVLSFGVKLAEKVGYRTTMFFGGIFISASFIINSLHTNFVGFIFIYCVFVGISTGLVYMLPILCSWKYQPFNRGRVSGIIIAGYGFGAFLMNFVCQAYVNPDNKKPSVVYIEDGKEHKYFDESVYERVPNMLRILGAVYFVLSMISVALVNYPKDLNLEFQQVLGNGKKPSGIDHKKQIEYNPTVLHSECESLLQGIKSKPFFYLLPMIFCSTLFGMFMANCYKIYGLYIGLDDQMLTIVGSCSAVTNGLSRAMWAMLMDKFGFRKVFIGIMVINLGCTASIGYIEGNGWAYLFILCITMGCEGGMFSCFPAITSKVFGHKVGPVLYGILFFFIGISNMCGYLLYRFVQPSLGFIGVFWICFVVKVIALVLGILFNEQHNWRRH